jgi:hypothetical protein
MRWLAASGVARNVRLDLEIAMRKLPFKAAQPPKPNGLALTGRSGPQLARCARNELFAAVLALNPVGHCGRAASRVCGVALLIDTIVAARQINTECSRR